VNLVSLIINLISGAVGGNAAGALMKDKSLGTLWNSISGILGGGVGGAILQALVPSLAGMAQGGGLDLGSIIGQIAGGGVGGGLLMVIVSLIKSAMASKS
jgi:uncharacterized membrane protein YeaQ/YmgE (transglycosylase-associated protein family)